MEKYTISNCLLKILILENHCTTNCCRATLHGVLTASLGIIALTRRSWFESRLLCFPKCPLARY